MSNIIQVSNIAATVTDENIKTLFGFVGSIRETIIYFEESQQEETKVAYIVYESNNDAETALHLHNTVFHDRALILLPLADCCAGQIPDINYAKVIRAPDKTVTGILPKSKTWPREVLSMVVGRTGEQSIITIEPNFLKQGLPTYPKLPYSTEVAKIDEIRRTVLVTNLDSTSNAQQVLDFFQPVAEVKFIRMAGSDNDNAAYVEFSEQSAIVKAFGLMGTNLNNRPIMIQHSNVAIVKPSTYLRGLDDSGKRLKDSDSVNGRSRSRSKAKRRSKSRKRSRSRRRSRSRKTSKSRKRSRSRKLSKSRKRSKSRSRRKSNSRPRRSRSRNRKTKKRSRTHSKDRKKRSRSREKKKERSRSRHRKTKKRSRSKHDSIERKSKMTEKVVIESKDTKSRDRKHKTDKPSRDDRQKKHSGSDSNHNNSDRKKVMKVSHRSTTETSIAAEKMNGEKFVHQRESSDCRKLSVGRDSSESLAQTQHYNADIQNKQSLANVSCDDSDSLVNSNYGHQDGHNVSDNENKYNDITPQHQTGECSQSINESCYSSDVEHHQVTGDSVTTNNNDSDV